MASPANIESLGWLKRIFGGSANDRVEKSSNASSTISSESPTARNRVLNVRNLLKELSPSSSTTNKSSGKSLRSLDSPVATLLKASNTKQDGGKRKRLSSEEEEPSLLEDIFTNTQTTAKRFRGSGSDSSFIEDQMKVLIPGLDVTCSGDTNFGEAGSITPSVRSLKSRLSGAASNSSSGLSSRTRTILQQLEKIHTPASEARRLPIVRRHSVASERWNHTGLYSPGAPPLRKIRNVAPTRLQLLSTTVGHNKKPYWKDIYRKPAETGPERKSPSKASDDNSSLNGSMLAPILDVPEPNKDADEPRVSKMKGYDGVTRNVFKGLLEEEEQRLPIPKPVPLKMTAPVKGFLDGLNFTFDLPKDRRAQIPQPEHEEDTGSCSSEEDSDEEDEESYMDEEESDAEEDSDEEEDEEESDASSISSTKENTPTAASSSPKILQVVAETKKPASPSATTVTAAPHEKWDCSACFVSNTGDNCVCCGTAKGGKEAAAPKKELVSNISTFAKPTTSVSFGFGAQKTTSVSTTVESKKEEEKRVAWDCPDCMVSNKAEQDSCPCCGHVKYKSAGGGMASVFGANAFKPTPSSSTVSFGLSDGVAKPTMTYSFGFGSKPAEPAKEDTVKAPVAVAASSVPFGSSASSSMASSAPSTFATEERTKNSSISTDRPASALFGSSTLTFNGLSTSTASTGGVPLFGALSKPVETTTAPAVSTLFGSTSSTSSASNPFGASVKPPEPVSTSLFGFKPPEVTAAPSSLFGATPTDLVAPPAPRAASTIFAFGASAPSASATPPVNTPLFGTAPTMECQPFGAGQDKPLFSGSAKASAPSPFQGSATPGFGCLSQPAPVQPTVPLFGAAAGVHDPPSAKKPMCSFGEPATAPFSSGGNLFGNSAPNVFGNQSGSSSLFGVPAPAPPSLSTSSSTNSLFGASMETPPSFNFGGAPAVGGNQPFMFGSGAPPAPPTLNVGQAAPPVPGGSFAYTASSTSTGGGISAGARKIAAARRRMPGRR